MPIALLSIMAAAFYALYFRFRPLRTCTDDLSLDNSLSPFDPETC